MVGVTVQSGCSQKKIAKAKVSSQGRKGGKESKKWQEEH